MPRIARIVIPGRPHHVTQRGNDRQDVFFADGECSVYLDTLREHASRFGLTIDACCYSSAKARVEDADPTNLHDWRGFRRAVPPEEDWRLTLQRPEDDARLATLRLHLNRSRPLASASFIEKLETQLPRRLSPQPVGRPLKARHENVKNR